MAENTMQVQHLDPRVLLTDQNIRTTAELSRDFIASITELGVLVPIVAVQAEDGVRVRRGHRRTLAAIEAGLATVPVWVVDEDQADETHRIVTQWAENEHRTGLTDGEQIAAVQQLALLGVSAAQIAKRTKTKRAVVNDALTVAGSELATAATARYELTIEQAAAIAEFEDDAETVKALVASTRTRQFGHVVQAARDARAHAAERDRIIADLTAAGVTVQERDDLLAGYRTVIALGIERDGHAGCPGHAAYLNESWRGEWETVTVCMAPAEHHPESVAAQQRGLPSTTTGGGMSEEQKAERRRVIANNKAWVSAETVRRDWLRTFLARKTPPKGSAAYVATELLHGGSDRGDGATLAADLLGGDITGQLATATEARASVIALGVVLAAGEASTDRSTWRSPTRAQQRYFSALVQFGYELSEVEQLVTGSKRTRRRVA